MPNANLAKIQISNVHIYVFVSMLILDGKESTFESNGGGRNAITQRSQYAE
jgi:hypothetical protein